MFQGHLLHVKRWYLGGLSLLASGVGDTDITVDSGTELDDAVFCGYRKESLERHEKKRRGT